MRSYQPDRLEQLEDPATLQRLKPFLSDVFDPISLDRPGFLQEIGLKAEDEGWLRAGAYVQGWLPTPIVPRAFAEEARLKKLKPAEFIERSLGLVEESLWRQAERLFLRCQRLVLHPEASKVARQLGLKLVELEALRTRWKAEMITSDQWALDGLMLQLRGVGQAGPALVKRMEEQTTQKFWFFFRRLRPILTQVSDDEIEVNVALSLGDKTYAVAASFAKEMDENKELSPELWAKQWADYLGKRSRVSQDEFCALLDHFQDKDRYKWPNLVALARAKARRAVAAVALTALERLESAEDTASLERLWQMIPDFSERYELQQVLKKRFGLGL
jgi:hypothetical protein